MCRKLKPNEIECRVAQVTAKGCTLLLYKTARVDRAILDEQYGNLWQNDFKVIDGKMYGGIGIYDKDLQQWLWRWDCGVESNTEAEKGQASDCFKRAGFKWGIGIELYSAPFIFILEPTEEKNGKYYLKDKFKKFIVKEIEYDNNNNISFLRITDSKGKDVFKFDNTSANDKMKKIEEKNKEYAKDMPTNDDVEIIKGLSECKTLTELKDYYSLNYSKVKDKKAFAEMKDQKKLALFDEAVA